jgi:hypothetical protein
MACGGCAKRNKTNINKDKLSENDLLFYKVFGNYKYLTDRQIKARLEIYKKRNCKGCPKFNECDIGIFLKCKDIKIRGG